MKNLERNFSKLFAAAMVVGAAGCAPTPITWHVQVCRDGNLNGACDPNESGIPGQFTLYDIDTPSDPTIVASGRLDESGRVTLETTIEDIGYVFSPDNDALTCIQTGGSVEKSGNTREMTIPVDCAKG